MNTTMTSASRRFACAQLIVFVFMGGLVCSGTTHAANKITAEEVIAKHLASIGTAEARAAVKCRIIIGGAHATFRGLATGALDGRVVLASENASNMILMRFSAAEYPREAVGYDGKLLTVGFVRPGVRSQLGNFLLTHDTVFRQGLLGGALSSAWSPAISMTSEVQFDYTGVSKVGDRTAHKLRYRPRRTSDLEVTLFFDAENFRHLRTQYERVIAPQMGSTDTASAQQRETRYRLIEDFTDFKQQNNFTLPHTYNLQFSVDGNRTTLTYSWKLSLEQFTFNKPIAASSFNVAT